MKEHMIKLKKIIEGFDPTSQGPNAQQENPYPAWNRKMRTMETATSQLKTFTEIRNELDPDGTKHDLTLKCVKCGITETCRCSKPKRQVEGICNKCSGTDLRGNKIS